jgi:CheY-like chemotaxis protein
MVFGFVKQSLGHVSVQSDIGKGTTFRVYLPRANIAWSELAPDRDTTANPTGQECILVVEDNTQLRRIAVRQLQSQGYSTEEAATANDALVVLNEHTGIDLLFTDVVLPGGLDGIELAQRARLIRPSIRILIASGFPGRQMDDPALQGLPFLPKPYSQADLSRAVRLSLRNG